jgi:hypothetical protein
MTRSAPHEPGPTARQHHDRPANALAYDPAAARHFERVGDQVTAATARPSGLAARYWQHVIEHAVEHRAMLDDRY